MCKVDWSSSWIEHFTIDSDSKEFSGVFGAGSSQWTSYFGVSGGIVMTGTLNGPCYEWNVGNSASPSSLSLQVSLDVPDRIEAKLVAHGTVAGKTFASLDGEGLRASGSAAASLSVTDSVGVDLSVDTEGVSDASRDDAAVGQIGEDPSSLQVDGKLSLSTEFALVDTMDPRRRTRCYQEISVVGHPWIYVYCHGELSGLVRFDSRGRLEEAKGLNGWTAKDVTETTDEKDNSHEGSARFLPP